MRAAVSRSSVLGAAMSDAAGLATLLGIFGLLALMVVHRLIAQRRLLSSGRKLCAARLVRDGGKLVFAQQVTFSTVGEWCRLLLALRAEGKHEMRRRPFRRKVAFAVGTPYTLTITDPSGEAVYREQSSLATFASSLRSSDWGAGSVLREWSSSTCRGRLTLLEFMPRRIGTHEIALQIQVRADEEAPGSSSYWEVLEAELTVTEGVEPLSKIAKTHRRVQL